MVDFFFAEEDDNTEKQSRSQKKPWKILIADDEPEVHEVTQIVLNHYTLDGIGVNFLHAYNELETKQLITDNPDIAIILLDVVMDRENSGLLLAKWIRESARNKFVRIILRTGQPGYAPESEVIRDYDINDYKEKTELTVQKLFTSITASIRAYRDLRTIERNRRGLEQIISASANMFELQSMKIFARRVLHQLTVLLHMDEAYLPEEKIVGIAFHVENDRFYAFAGIGQYKDLRVTPAEEVLVGDDLELLKTAVENQAAVIEKNVYIGYYKSVEGHINLLYLRGKHNLNEFDKELLRIFSSNVSIAFANIYLNQELEKTQREVIFTLGEVVETRSKETGNHVKRVATISGLLATQLGLGEDQAELLKLASPMHDVGKIGIPDQILHKPGKLNEEEYEIVKKHTVIGYDILKSSQQKIMQAAAIIALQHHERWDGMGYPYGLKGEDIHIFGRITTVADVFDALQNKRVYKEAWTVDQIVEFFKSERGKLFDPVLVDIFLEHIDEVLEISRMYSD